jgi:hypothetical protein
MTSMASPTEITFAATIEQAGKTATGIEVPPEVLESLGAGRRPPLVVTLGGYTYRTTPGGMGGRTMIPLSAEHRTGAGVHGGDQVDVTVAVDTAPRTVEVPADLAEALAAASLTETFDRLAPSHRKEHVRSVLEAKAADTRQRRIDKVVSKLSG